MRFHSILGRCKLHSSNHLRGVSSQVSNHPYHVLRQDTMRYTGFNLQLPVDNNTSNG